MNESLGGCLLALRISVSSPVHEKVDLNLLSGVNLDARRPRLRSAFNNNGSIVAEAAARRDTKRHLRAGFDARICRQSPLQSKWNGDDFVFEAEHPHPCALSKTCKQIKTESLPIFLSQNTFIVQLDIAARDTDDCNINYCLPQRDINLLPLWHFIQTAGEMKVSKLRIHTDIGSFRRLSLHDFFTLKDMLKAISSKKEHCSGECFVTFTLQYHSYTRREDRDIECTVDAWNLREWLPTISAIIRKEASKVNGDMFMTPACDIFAAWMRADWTAWRGSLRCEWQIQICYK